MRSGGLHDTSRPDPGLGHWRVRNGWLNETVRPGQRGVDLRPIWIATSRWRPGFIGAAKPTAQQLDWELVRRFQALHTPPPTWCISNATAKPCSTSFSETSNSFRSTLAHRWPPFGRRRQP